MKAKDKKLIINAITQTKSFNFWGHILIRQYIHELQQQIPQIPGTYNRETYEQHIIDWVEKADPKLERFLHYNQTFERERTKTTALNKLDSSRTALLQSLTDNFQEQSYDPHGAGTWNNPKLVFAHANNDEYEFWFAIKAEKHFNHPLSPDELGEDTREEIEAMLKNLNPNYESLEELVAKYSIFSRIVNIAIVHKKNGNLLFSTDQPKLIDPDIDEKKGIAPESRLDEFINQFPGLVGVKNPEKIRDEIKKHPRISPKAASNIRAFADKNTLIVPYKHEQKFDNGELSEKNSNTFENFTINLIRKAAKEHFETNSSFERFFEKHANLDAERQGRIIKIITNEDGIVRTATGFFFCVINADGHIEISKVFVNSALGSLRIIAEKGGQENARLHEELDRIFS